MIRVTATMMAWMLASTPALADDVGGLRSLGNGLVKNEAIRSFTIDKEARVFHAQIHRKTAASKDHIASLVCTAVPSPDWQVWVFSARESAAAATKFRCSDLPR